MNFRKLIEYFKALKIKGGVLTVVGLLPFFIDDILNFYFSLSLDIPVWVSLLWFILGFGWANFSLYTKLTEAESLIFDIVEVKSVWLNGIDPSKALIDDIIVVGVQVLALISSPKMATSVRLFVDSVEPNCLAQGDDIEIKLRSATGDLENPCWLRGDEMKNVQLTAKVPLSTACLERLVGSLSKFTEIAVVVGAEQTGNKPVYQSVRCSLVEAHKRIEEEVTMRLQHLQSARFPPDQFQSMLRRYWRGKETS